MNKPHGEKIPALQMINDLRSEFKTTYPKFVLEKPKVIKKVKKKVKKTNLFLVASKKKAVK